MARESGRGHVVIFPRLPVLLCMRHIAFSCLVLCLIVACSSAPPAPGPRFPVSELDRMTVALVDDDHVFCSGVWIDRDLILTAAHCTHDGLYSYVTYQTPAGDTEAAYVARRDEASDLALLLAAVPPSHATAALAPGNPPEGEDVDIVGHPAGFVWTLSRGCVSGYRVRDEEHVRMQLSAPVFFGNSGGGAFVR